MALLPFGSPPPKTLVAGTNITLTPSGSNITIATTSGGSAIAPTVQRFTSTLYVTFTVTSANATAGATYTDGYGSTVTVLRTIVAGTTLETTATQLPTGSTLTKASGTGDATIAFSADTNTGIYHTPTSPAPLYIKVTMVGAGGGGGGSASGFTGGTGGTGGNTTFGASLTAGGGSGGQGNTGSGSLPGSGGTNTISIGTTLVNVQGGGGGTGDNSSATAGGPGGGIGGSSAFGGAGAGGAAVVATNGISGVANSGGGGGGGGEQFGVYSSGNGGGSGGFIQTIISSPSSTYTFTIGVGGAGGTGTTTGGNGGSGFILVEEFYSLAAGSTTSGITRSINSISSPATAGATALTDYVYFVSGTTTLTLPTAVGNTNLYTVKNAGVNTVSIATTSAQTIDGSASPITLPVANTSLDLISDGSNWRIV